MRIWIWGRIQGRTRLGEPTEWVWVAGELDRHASINRHSTVSRNGPSIFRVDGNGFNHHHRKKKAFLFLLLISV
ncbi:hypothetical protein TorRG33x02_288470 [Trema orientale]|uniref:Uncharacterized protein n=1 Tax=Trema orientale TaxID=63057 RepID=A0A2P5CE72_TREOI|nr:hypothetical protein TorRG33x02_288470 [Trema orientale]